MFPDKKNGTAGEDAVFLEQWGYYESACDACFRHTLPVPNQVLWAKLHVMLIMRFSNHNLLGRFIFIIWEQEVLPDAS